MRSEAVQIGLWKKLIVSIGRYNDYIRVCADDGHDTFRFPVARVFHRQHGEQLSLSGSHIAQICIRKTQTCLNGAITNVKDIWQKSNANLSRRLLVLPQSCIYPDDRRYPAVPSLWCTRR